MPGIPTANHAYNLFSLTMEGRFGRSWSEAVAPQSVAELAHEIAAGFGGKAEAAEDADATIWRFPDGSRAWTGSFGLKQEAVAGRAA